METAMKEPAKFTPQLLSQFANVGDPLMRQTYEYKNPLGTMTNKVKNKVPGLRKTLQPTVDVLGREVKNNNSIFNTFKLSDQEKAELLKKAYNYAVAKAKSQVSSYELDGNNVKIYQAEKKGISPSQYLSITAKADADGNGSISQEEMENALNRTSLSRTQKKYLFELQNPKWKKNPFN